MSLFSAYLALGDSISIDLYPALDLQFPTDAGLGAASLLYQNRDDLYPSFRGRDLRARFPGISFQNLTADGATTSDVLTVQLPLIRPTDQEVVVTVTAGGNDMLQHLGGASAQPDLVEGMVLGLLDIVSGIRLRLPRSTVLLGTVYDPSDGTNTLEGRRFDREAGWLAQFNGAVRSMIDSSPGLLLADIHQTFLGHGVTAPPRERWYWSGLIFEPNARGASEIRRLWLECLGL